MMTAESYRAALDALDLSLSDAAHLFGVKKRKARHWATGKRPVPRAVEIALTLMLALTYPDEAGAEVAALREEIRARYGRQAA